MPLIFTEDILPISHVKKHTRDTFNHVHRSGRPVVVTVNGKPDVVLIDVKVFESKLKTLNLASLLQEGEEDVKRNKLHSARALLRDLRKRATALPR